MALRDDEEAEGGLPAFVGDPIGVLRRRGRWMAGVLVLALITITLAIHLLVPVSYLAQATLLVRDQQIPGTFVSPSVTDNPLGTVDALVSEVLSRQQLQQVVDEFKLYPNIEGPRARLAVVDRLRRDIQVSPTARLASGPTEASVYTIAFRYYEPRVGADVANALASRFVAAHSANRGRQARLTTEFMRAELQRSDREMREHEAEIARFKSEHRGELPSEFAGTSARLERLYALRQTLALQISSAESRMSMLAEGGGAQAPDSPFTRLASLRAALAAEVAVNTEEHPNVISLRRQIEAVERQVETGDTAGVSADAMIQAARDEVAALRRQLADVDAESRRLEEQVARTPQREEQMAALEQRAEVLRETYLSNLRKVKAAELSESLESAQQGARVQVIDRAEPPTRPDGRRLRFLLVGIAASFGAAAAIGVLLELIDPVVVSAKQLEDELGLPILGSVGWIG